MGIEFVCGAHVVVVMIETKVNDGPTYSKLNVYINYTEKRNGTVKWNKNDLNLREAPSTGIIEDFT